MKSNNEAIYAEVMKQWDCTYAEAIASIEYDCKTLTETRKAIAEAVTRRRLSESLMPDALHYMRESRYKGQDVTDDFLESEAKELVSDQIELFVDQWGNIDDYEDMTEEEIQEVVFGSSVYVK